MRRSIVTDIFGIKYSQPINQKLKGNRNELQVAKLLGELTGVQFVRTPASGGRRLANAKNFCGDVVCADDNYYFPFVVETKHLKKIHTPKRLPERSEILTIFNKQALPDARRAGKHPMLIIKQDGKERLLFVMDRIADLFEKHGAQPVSSGSGIRGFRLLEIRSFDLIVIETRLLPSP